MTPRVAYAEILDGETKKTAVAFWLRVVASFPGNGVAVKGRPHRSGRTHNTRGNYTHVSRSWPFPPVAKAAGEVGSSRFKRWSIRSLFVFK